MDDIWIEVCFDGEPVDNLIANNELEAKEIIEDVLRNGFDDYNEEVKEWWLELGFRNNPVVTAYIKN